MIDFILTNRVITTPQVLNIRAVTSANLWTDHNLVLCKILLKRPHQKRKPPQVIENYNMKSLTAERTKLLFENRVIDKSKEVDLKPEWRVKVSWQNAAEEANGKRKINMNATNHTKRWFYQEVNELSELKRKCYPTYKSAPSEGTHRICSRKKQSKRKNKINRKRTLS